MRDSLVAALQDRLSCTTAYLDDYVYDGDPDHFANVLISQMLEDLNAAGIMVSAYSVLVWLQESCPSPTKDQT